MPPTLGEYTVKICYIEQEFAEKVIKILLTADGGCEYCVSSLLDLFCKEFPEYRGFAEKAFEKSFGKKLYFKGCRMQMRD